MVVNVCHPITGDLSLNPRVVDCFGKNDLTHLVKSVGSRICQYQCSTAVKLQSLRSTVCEKIANPPFPPAFLLFSDWSQQNLLTM